MNESLLASRMKALGTNAIREILKVVSQPGMVSLAGGIPAPDSFPVALIESLTASVLKKYGASALQYDATEGFAPLREALSVYLVEKNIKCAASDILVFSGSQGVLDAIGKVLIDPKSNVAVEAPTYLGALQAFNPYEPNYLSVKTDNQGLIPESLEQVLQTHKMKFLYLVPTFQNPTGRTIPMERRTAIAKLLIKYDALLIEDDPYCDLRYTGEPLPPIKTLAPDNVVYISTLSKIFAPGLRLGFVVAPEWLQQALVIAKQGTDLHTSTFNQALAAEYLSGGHLVDHLPKIIELYRPKQKAMLDAMTRFFPDTLTWTQPDGGMFIWVEGPKGMDMEEVYWEALKRKTAFVPGKFFFARQTQNSETIGAETMRLNYTMANEETLTNAIAVLGEVIHLNLKHQT